MFGSITALAFLFWVAILQKSLETKDLKSFGFSMVIIALHWLYCRWSGKIEDFSGFGTRLHPVYMADQPIQMVWIDLLGISILPVRTYLVPDAPQSTESVAGKYSYSKTSLTGLIKISSFRPSVIFNLPRAIPGWILVALLLALPHK